MSEQVEFAKLDDFYLADVRRYASTETDFGLHWVSPERPFPTWRLSYTQLTGEVYATENTVQGRVRVLGVIPADEPDPLAAVTPGYVPHRDCWYETADRVLAGWERPEETGWRLAWVERRLHAAAYGAAPGVPCGHPGGCPLGHSPGLPSPCLTSGRCARRDEVPGNTAADQGMWCDSARGGRGCLSCREAGHCIMRWNP